MQFNDQLGTWCDRLAKPYLRRSSGVVVGVSFGENLHYAQYGIVDATQPSTPTAATLFEIGSVTKVFTALLLAKLTRAGLIDPDEPIGRIWPVVAQAPKWITPRALATHTSGLPRVPFTLWQLLRISYDNPFADFGNAELAKWMHGYRGDAPRKGATPRYSNLGMGLLGAALAHVGGDSYETVLRRNVLEPLGLDDTVVTMDQDHNSRFAIPHRPNGKAALPWDFDVIAGAGALRSTAQDLITFGRAVLTADQMAGPISAAIFDTLQVQVPSANPKHAEQCLGWIKLRSRNTDMPFYFHDGGTHGSRSALFVVPDARLIVVLLANTGGHLWNEIAIANSKPDTVLEEIVASI